MNTLNHVSPKEFYESKIEIAYEVASNQACPASGRELPWYDSDGTATWIMSTTKVDTCPHAQRTIPSTIYIKAEDSQEVIGVATIRVCIECGHIEGTVVDGSLFSSMAPQPFTVEPNGDIGIEARKVLLAKQSPWATSYDDGT